MNATAMPAPTAPVTPTELAKPARPVTLQIRRSCGVWWNAATFDATDERRCDAVETAVELLCTADPTLHARIVVSGLHSAGILKSYHVATGWVLGE